MTESPKKNSARILIAKTGLDNASARKRADMVARISRRLDWA